MSKKFKRNKLIKFTVTATVLIVAVVVAYFTGYKGLGNNFVKNGGSDFSEDFIKVIDVGQAECILVYSNGYSALFDVGEAENSADICSVLGDCGVEEIDVIAISHLHTDHIGGIKDIMEVYPVANLILPELSTDSEGMFLAQFAINKVTEDGGEVYNAKSGMNFKIGDFEITVLAAYEGMDENNSSIIAVAKIGSRKFMFTGDAETKTEKLLLREGLDLKCDILSVGHHGSSTSSSRDFLSAVKPKYAVISAGANNMYGHPHNEVLSAFENMGSKIFRTDLQGDITFNFKDDYISVKTEK